MAEYINRNNIVTLLSKALEDKEAKPYLEPGLNIALAFVLNAPASDVCYVPELIEILSGDAITDETGIHETVADAIVKHELDYLHGVNEDEVYGLVDDVMKAVRNCIRTYANETRCYEMPD